MGENLLSHQPVKNIAVGGGDRLLSTVQQKVPMLFSFLPIPSHLFTVWWPGAQSARDNHVLACNFAKYSPIKKNSLMDLAINLS